MGFQDRYKQGAQSSQRPKSNFSFQSRYKTSYRDLPFVEKRDIANIRDLEELQQAGQLQEFEQYKRGNPVLSAIRQAGSGVLDVLNRGEYAVAGAIQETLGGDPGVSPGEARSGLSRAGQELFSGIGGIKGQKTTFGEVMGQVNPEYGQFRQEHKIASIPIDLALSVGLDPTTYFGGTLFKPIAKAAKKVVAPIGKAIKATGAYDVLSKTFSPGYAWTKKGLDAGYDIKWSELQYSKNLSKKLTTNMQPALEEIATWTPETTKTFVRVMYGDIPLDVAPKVVKDVAATLKLQLKKIGRRESKYLGIDPKDWLRENYLPNSPKQFTDLMQSVGESTSSKNLKGLALWKPGQEHAKVLNSGEQLLDWLQKVGVPDDKLPEVITRNLLGRAHSSAARIRNIRLHTKLTRDLPETFRELPAGNYQAWSKEILPGETPWTPAGNLRFFPQTKWDMLPSEVRKVLEQGGELSDEALAAMEKTSLGISGKVKAYAVPIEIAEDLNKVSQRLASPGTLVEWWDKSMQVWKNMAIFSTYFHSRNFWGSGAQNYLADIKPTSYIDIGSILMSKNKNKLVSGKSVGGWTNTMKRYGVLSGSFIGQEVGSVAMLGKNVDIPFQISRKVGTGIENVHRGALFVDGIKKGMSPLDAAKRVKKFHFDYQELTDVERNVFRRAMPFYSWMRKNIPLQIEMIMKAPGKYRDIQKLKDAIAGGGEGRSENAPDWWKEQDVWETKFQDKEGNKLGLSVGLPYSDLNQITRGEQMMGTLGPMGVAASLAQNYSPFLGRKIQEFRGEKEAGIPVKLKFAIEGFIPIAKRYGFDLVEAYQRVKDKDPRGFYKLLSQTGVRIIPLTKDEEERNRVYGLFEQLRDFEKYQNQEEEKLKLVR